MTGPARWLLLALSYVACHTAGAETPLSRTQDLPRTDFIVAGIGGIGAAASQGGGVGALTVTGISGNVSLALLYWNGIDWDQPAQGFVGGDGDYDESEIQFDGSAITGTRIAGGGNNDCWGEPTDASAATYRADVTLQVSARGNGSYTFSGLSDHPGHSANGMSLIVYFNDGNAANDVQVRQYEGLRSLTQSDWGFEFALDYRGGPVDVVLHVSDGQAALPDGQLRFSTTPGYFNVNRIDMSFTTINGIPKWAGLSVPAGAAPRSGNGLWDIQRFPLTAMYGPPRSYRTRMSSAQGSDCVSLHVVQLVQPADAAAPSLSPNPFDFGDVRELTQSAPRLFTLTNHQPFPITVSASLPPNVGTGGWFAITSENCSGQTLARGASCTVSVACTPPAFGSVLPGAALRIPWTGGALSGTHYATLDCASIPEGSFARLEIEPVSCDFGDVALGSLSSGRRFAMRSSGTLPLTLTTVAPPANGFVITGGNCTAGMTLAPGSACTLDVAFQAPAIGAVRTSEVAMVYAASNNPSSVRRLSLRARATTLTPSVDSGEFKDGFELDSSACGAGP